MTELTIERCARAIAEVRDKYSVLSAAGSKNDAFVVDHEDGRKPAFSGLREECQAWIDEQAARACVAELLPVSDGALALAETAFDDEAYRRQHRACHPDDLLQGITAAITAVLEGKA